MSGDGNAEERAAGHLRLVGDSDGQPSAQAVLDGGLSVAYQPIVHLGSGSVLAYEALARPRHEAVSNPLAYFRLLEEGGLRLRGEFAAFETAMAGVAAATSEPRTKLFVNASPNSLVHPDFDELELLDLVARAGLSPADLVVEVTESEAVEDLASLAARGERLRRLGIGMAVDDAGAGHASFRVITRLRPGYIKLDRDIVSNVDSDGARHAFIDAMVGFARRIGSRLIAEGIETEAELACLAGLGVEAGQGYLLGKPEIGCFPKPTAEARRIIAQSVQRLRLGGAQVTIGELAKSAATIASDATVAAAYARFLADPSIGVLVLCDDARGRGVGGQLTRRALERLLASPGAWERFAERPAVDFADHQAVTVSAQLDIAEVGRIIGARQRHQVTDDLVVTDALGSLLGVVPVRDVVRVLADLRRGSEQDLSPLTGMSGPSWLERELARRLAAEDAVTAVLVDLDGFRRVNELGGYALGDEVVRSLGVCLTSVVARIDGAAVVHAGADDFVALVPPPSFEEFISELVRGFESEVMALLRTELRLRDAFDALDEFALSIAATELSGGPPPGLRHLDWLEERVATALTEAQRYPGHCAVRPAGSQLAVTHWRPREGEQRTISIGRADPALAEQALDLVEAVWEEWLAEDDAQSRAAQRFPGPVETLERLRARYLVPLRAAVTEARGRGESVSVALSGPERELLELLDRVALVARRGYASSGAPTPGELGLLDRLLRRRARALDREDWYSRPAGALPGSGAVTEADAGA